MLSIWGPKIPSPSLSTLPPPPLIVCTILLYNPLPNIYLFIILFFGFEFLEDKDYVFINILIPSVYYIVHNKYWLSEWCCIYWYTSFKMWLLGFFWSCENNGPGLKWLQIYFILVELCLRKQITCTEKCSMRTKAKK